MKIVPKPQPNFNVGDRVFIERISNNKLKNICGKIIAINYNERTYDIYGNQFYTYDILLDNYTIVRIDEKYFCSEPTTHPIDNTYPIDNSELTYYPSISVKLSQKYNYDWGKSYPIPKPKRIISKPNDKITIIIWDDKSKTISKCSEGDKYDIEQGIMNCVVKKIFGTRREYKRFLGYDKRENNNLLVVEGSDKKENNKRENNKSNNKNNNSSIKPKFNVGDIVQSSEKNTVGLIGEISHIYEKGFNDGKKIVYAVKINGYDGHDGLLHESQLIDGEERDLGNSGYFLYDEEIELVEKYKTS